MTDEHVQELSDGTSIPLLGLGVWQVRDGAPTVDAVRWALELGYRHIDTAQAYGNEKGVGRGLAESGVPREQVYITTKFQPNKKDRVGNRPPGGRPGPVQRGVTPSRPARGGQEARRGARVLQFARYRQAPER